MSTAYYRSRGRPSIAEKAESQEFLNSEEKQTLLASIRTQLLATGCIRAGEVRTLATNIRYRRPSVSHGGTVTCLPKPPGKNWASDFLKARSEDLRIRNARGLGWLMVVADFVPQPSDYQQLCSNCASINLRLETVMPRRPNESRKIHSLQPSQGESKERTCKLCRFVQMCAQSWCWPAADKFSIYIHHMDNVFGPTFADNKVLLSFRIEDNSLKGKHQGWIVPTMLGSEDEVTAPPAWGQLKKTVEFDRIREWLMFCNQNHLTDCRMPSLDTIPFFWLIDCTTRSIVDAPDQAEYIALSYCWGPASNTTLENPSELPAVAALVIEDALKVACELGIPYLWVDRYCVSQSIRDIQAPQLQNMHKVYRSAYATIIAGCGEDPDFGLPGVTMRYRKTQVSVETHGHYLRCIPDVQHDIHKCRWSTRGWTYQENLLSKRRLVFTESQVYFQCWNMHCSESTPLRLEEAHTKDLTRLKESIDTLRVFPQKGIGKTSNEVVARIQEYLDRRFSHGSDALNAFLGIYEAFKELKDPIYNFWGLPISTAPLMESHDHDPNGAGGVFDQLHNSFLSSFSWSMDACDQPSAHFLTRRCMFPSWTWAAWEGLGTFSPKAITDNRYSPSVSFRTYQGQHVKLNDFTSVLGTGSSTVCFEPCVYLSGWVANVRLVQRNSDDKSTPSFQISWPVPTHRLAVIADADTATSLQQRVSTDSFQALLTGSDSRHDGDGSTPSTSLANVHAILLQPGPNNTHTRLGVLTWTRLAQPSFDATNNVMSINEIVEARAIVPQCPCACESSRSASFDYYLQHPDHVLAFRKMEVKLV